MLKTFSLCKLALDEGGEYVLGMKDLHTHACYMIYGELKPSEKGRKICPGQGHEEILLAVNGDLEISGEIFSGLLEQGNAIHLKETEACTIGNSGKAVVIYVLAGGHSGAKH